MVGSGRNPERMCVVDADRVIPRTPKPPPHVRGKVFPGKAQKDGKAFLMVSRWILMVCAENVHRSFLYEAWECFCRDELSLFPWFI